MFIGSYPIQRGGSPIYQPIGGSKKGPGVYVVGPDGQDDYTFSGGKYYGKTFADPYTIYYYEILSDGSRVPANPTQYSSTTSNDLEPGVNPDILINGQEFSASVVMTLLTFITILDPPNTWYFDQENVYPNVLILGGSFSDTFRGGREYVGPYDPSLGWGDYSLLGEWVDPNGVATPADNTGLITAKWQPKLIVTGYNRDGNDPMINDVQPPVSISGTESIKVEFYVNADYALDENGNPVYDINGEVGVVGGTRILDTDLSINPGDNSVNESFAQDSAGVIKNIEPFLITRVPDVELNDNFQTTVSLEELGTNQYIPVNGLTIDKGLSNEFQATPDEAPYVFDEGFKTYNEKASYTYQGTDAKSEELNVNITYNEFALQFDPPPNPEEFFALIGYEDNNQPPNPEEFFAIIGA